MQALGLAEKIYVLTLSILILYVFFKSFLSKRKIEIFSPLMFIALVYLIYTVIGPLIFINIDMKVFPKKFIRQFYEPAWLGSLVSFIFIMVGYYIKFGKNKYEKRYKNRFSKLFIVAVLINITGLILYIIPNPSRFIAQLNPLHVSDFSNTQEMGGFLNYLNMGINFLIVGNSLLLLSIKKINLFNPKLWFFILFTILTISIYSSLGFRYRLLLLFSTLIISYYLSIKKRPSILIVAIIIPIFIMSMGIIGMTRNHEKGLNIEKLNKNKDANYLLSAFRETNIFPISGAVIKAVPDKVDYVYEDIFVNTLILPIPRKFLPQKSTDKYIRDPIKKYKQLKRIDAHKWAAMLFFAEWYIAFGWFGLIGISFLFGFGYRRLWEWTKANINNRYVIVIYSASVAFIYFFITRGYLPGALTIFVFSVLPSNIAGFLVRLRIYPKSGKLKTQL